MISVRYEGLRETLQALRTVNHELYEALLSGLEAAGRIVQADARQKFIQWGSGGVFESESRQRGITKAAEGFDVRVRPNTSSYPILSVGQSIRRSGDMARRRSNLGDLFMRKALLPARKEKMVDVVTAIDRGVASLLHEHGF